MPSHSVSKRSDPVGWSRGLASATSCQPGRQHDNHDDDDDVDEDEMRSTSDFRRCFHQQTRRNGHTNSGIGMTNATLPRGSCAVDLRRTK